MRVHIIGAGLIGSKRASVLQVDDSLVNVRDVDANRASALMEAYGNPGDAEPRDGDAVIVATTHDQLVSMAIPYAERGCHVLVEKPGARTHTELESLQAAMRPQRTLGVGYNHRFHPGILKLYEIAKSEEFGPLQHIRARYGHGGRPGYEREWRADREVSGGGELLDQGSHLLDLTRFLAGDFEVISGHLATLHWNMAVEDNAWLLGLLPERRTLGVRPRASLHASWTEWKNLFSFEVFFTTAKVEVRGLGGSYGPEILAIHHMKDGPGPPTVTSIEFPPGDASWAHEWMDFKKRSQGNSGLGASGEDGMATLTIIQEVYANAHK